MTELTKKFSINDVVIDRNSEDKDFAIAEIWGLSEGNNSHRNPISRQVLEDYAYTFKGKFIIGKYDILNKDTKGHELKEDIYGYVSVTDEPQFKTKLVDGEEREFVVLKAYLSKIYAKQIVDMFKIDNKRSVSCEFTCALEYEEDEYGRPLDEYGNPMDIDNPILAYSISGITILGKKINPSVKEADIVMKRFSEDSNKLETKSKGDNMEEVKELSEQPKDEQDIVMAEESEDTKEFPKDKEDDTEEMSEVETTEEIAEEPSEDETEDTTEEMSDEDSKEVETEEMQCDETEEMECGDSKDMSCETTEEMSEEEPQQEEKLLSEQAVEFAEEDYKEFVGKLFSSELKDFVEEVVEMKKFMDETIKTNTEKRFAEIMVEPKLCLGEKAYTVLFEEGSKLTLGELDAFETKVKAFCEDAPRKQEVKEDELLKFASDDVTVDKQQNLDVWSRIANN